MIQVKSDNRILPVSCDIVLRLYHMIQVKFETLSHDIGKI